MSKRKRHEWYYNGYTGISYCRHCGIKIGISGDESSVETADQTPCIWQPGDNTIQNNDKPIKVNEIMRQIRVLVARGWNFNMYMGSKGCFFVSASHNTWGEAEGASDNLNEAIDQMFKQAKKLESEWRAH